MNMLILKSGGFQFQACKKCLVAHVLIKYHPHSQAAPASLNLMSDDSIPVYSSPLIHWNSPLDDCRCHHRVLLQNNAGSSSKKVEPQFELECNMIPYISAGSLYNCMFPQYSKCLCSVLVSDKPLNAFLLFFFLFIYLKWTALIIFHCLLSTINTYNEF